MPIRPTSIALDDEQRRKLAKDLFNHTWTLLEKEDRSVQESELMVNAAHASRFFWEEFAQPVHQARGEWQISRVYSTVGRAEPARHHARLCLEICERSELGDFDLGYAYEALARAHAVDDDLPAAAEYEKQARTAAQRITNAADRELLISDLMTLPRRAAAS